MRILIVRMWAEELDINNYNCQEIGLAKALIRKGNECDIALFTNGDSREEDYAFDNDKKIHIYYLKARKILKNCFFEKKLYELIKEYDIVQSSEYDQLANIKLKRIIGNKLVIYHGPYKSSFTKRYAIKCLITDIILLLFPWYKKTKIISKSDLAKDFLISKGFSNVTSVGVGLDLDRFKCEKQNEKIEKLKIEKSTYRYLLYIGTIDERKNTLFLLKVVNRMIEYNKNIKLIIVGKGQDAYIKKCHQYIVENQLDDVVKIYSSFKQDELPGLYKCCDLFLLPTQYEIFGMVLLEALYFKLGIITTLNGGSSNIIKKYKNCQICRNNDIEEWTHAITNQLEKIKQNKEKYVFEYTWDHLCDKFIEVYTK